MKCSFFYALLIVGLTTGCQYGQQDKTRDSTSAGGTSDTSVTGSGRATLLHALPEQYNTPDGLALAPDSSVIVSVPNFGNPSYPAALLRIANDTIFLLRCPNPSSAA